jgi:hypothetical protein
MGLTIVFTTHAPQHGLEVASHVLLMWTPPHVVRDGRGGLTADLLTLRCRDCAAFAEGGRPPSPRLRTLIPSHDGADEKTLM